MFSKSRSLFFLGVGLLGVISVTPAVAFAQAEKTMGKWTPDAKTLLPLPTVPIHSHVLPNGKVLFWGRRAWKDGKPVDASAAGFSEPDTAAFLWNPLAKDGDAFTALPKPGFNMFCAGHAFLADGRLLVVGGHKADTLGVRKAALFDPDKNVWVPTADMNAGRWYPTATTLPDGGVLTSFGTDENGDPNKLQQIWRDGKWIDSAPFNDPPYYPRMHVAPDGRVLMSGPLNLTQFFDTDKSLWTPLGRRSDALKANALMEYGAAVQYEEGKILYIGGGQKPPSDAAKIIDLGRPDPNWRDAKATMAYPRRHHNATLLPDGTVLVTGGTRGSGGPDGEANVGFNDLRSGQPVRTPELWDPATESWTKMADEGVDRCYHSSAVLLPDGRVLSGGGGEYFPLMNTPNALTDSHPDAQIFSPPYLFRGPRPDITRAPDRVAYKATFEVGTSKPDDVAQVTWIRLSSTTHSFNSGQRINFLKFTSDGSKLTVTSPASALVCPPGHYMLFVLNKAKVPSVARIINIR